MMPMTNEMIIQIQKFIQDFRPMLNDDLICAEIKRSLTDKDKYLILEKLLKWRCFLLPEIKNID